MNRSQGYAVEGSLWGLFIVGGGFLFAAAILYLETIPFLVKAKSVQGTVIELVPIPNDSSEGHVLYAPKVTFWEENRERRFEFVGPVGSDPPIYNEDERITVYYDPENPENARIGEIGLIVFTTIVLFFPGALCCLLGFLEIRKRLKIMRHKEM